MNRKFLLALGALLCSAAILLLTQLDARAQTSVFINELHYDNVGTDAGEAIELAATAGTDLSGWSLVLYNGNGGAPYATTPLTGIVADQQNGFGTTFVSYPSNGIQNGAPDGPALVDPSGGVVQFLSYEGSFVAVGGPADGQTSVDIGVAEGSDTPAGFSLQLTGSGTTYADFAWSAPSDDSFGQPNAGQSFGGGETPAPDPTSTPELTPTDPPTASSLLINEVDYDQPSTDVAEFVEIYNAGGVVNLGGYAIVLVNGNGAAPYETFDLPAVDLAADAFFVLCGDPANTPGCDLDVSPDSNLIQNGPDAVALTLNGNIVDAISYEDAVPGYVEGSAATGDSGSTPFVSLSRFPNGADTNDNSVDFSLRCTTPGTANDEATSDCPDPNAGEPTPTPDPSVTPEPTSTPEPLICGADATLISSVQGSSATSPLVGQTVSIEGVVVGDFQADDGDQFGTDLGGFHVQEEAADYDGSDETSEGVFVFVGGGSAPDVVIGQTVRVRGTVGEFANGGTSQTQVTNPSVKICGDGTAPAAVDITLPVPSVDFLERYEGMAVRLPQSLVIAEYFNFDRFGEIVLTQPLPGESRPYQPTAVEEPGSTEAAARAAYNALARLTLDDGRSSQNPDPARHPNGSVFDLSNRFRGGDTVTGAVGVLDNTFGTYRIQPTAGATYTRVNERAQQPEAVGGSLKVASFNVLNYFNGDGMGGGFPTSRGADDLNEFQRQEAKIVAAIIGTGADIVGLIEIENDEAGDSSALDDLTEALNVQAGARTYDYVRTGVIGGDEIKVAFVYKPATVTTVGEPAVLIEFEGRNFIDPRNIGPKNRPALAQTFRETATGGVLTVAVNHLKSKGSGCGPGDDDPEQGSCNGTRTDAADILVDWLASDPTGSGDPDYLIIGDLNAYDKEDPIDQIKEGADDAAGTADDYTDLALQFEGELAYSYLFGAQFGYLDYALANAPLLPQVAGVTEWHINADEPDILDYDTSFKQAAQDALYEPNPFRASDHDPVVVGLSLVGPVVADKSVRPVLECVVETGANSFTARFGYLNENDEAVAIPVGPDNKFSPDPQDRGQPTTFQPGRVVDAFRVDFDGGLLVWTLAGPDGSRRTATASSGSQRCAGAPNDLRYYVSLSTGGRVDDIRFRDEDILSYNLTTGEWALVFDGSDVGVANNDVNALHILDDGSILMSFNRPQNLPDLGNVRDTDVVRFVPTSLGQNTAGVFERYLDGASLGLVHRGKDIDAIGFAPDGRLLISTLGFAFVPASGGGYLLATDEDLLALEADSRWSLYFDGSDIRLTNYLEDVWALWVDGENGDLYLSTAGDFQTGGSANEVSGKGNDVFLCTPGSLGENTTCAVTPLIDGDAIGLRNKRSDGHAVAGPLPTFNGNIEAADTGEINDEADEVDDGLDDALDDDALDDDVIDDTLFLPLVTR